MGNAASENTQRFQFRTLEDLVPAPTVTYSCWASVSRIEQRRPALLASTRWTTASSVWARLVPGAAGIGPYSGGPDSALLSGVAKGSDPLGAIPRHPIDWNPIT
jgi:hypothetical protein